MLVSAKIPHVSAASNKAMVAFLISEELFSSFSRVDIISLIPKLPFSFSLLIVLSIKIEIGLIKSSPKVIIQSPAVNSDTSSANFLSAVIPFYKEDS